MTSMCSAIDLEKIKMSSMYTIIFQAIMRSWKIMFIITWKVAGEFSEAKEHHCGFKKAQRYYGVSLPLIPFFDVNIIVSQLDI